MSTFLATKDIEKTCLELCLRNKLLQKLFKEQAQSSLAFGKRQIKKNYFDALRFTALFAGERQRDDLRLAAQCNCGLSIFGTKDGNEPDASIWTFEQFEDICDVSLVYKQPDGEAKFQEDELFQTSVALSVSENFRKKNVMVLVRNLSCPLKNQTVQLHLKSNHWLQKRSPTKQIV